MSKIIIRVSRFRVAAFQNKWFTWLKGVCCHMSLSMIECPFSITTAELKCISPEVNDKCVYYTSTDASLDSLSELLKTEVFSWVRQTDCCILIHKLLTDFKFLFTPVLDLITILKQIIFSHISNLCNQNIDHWTWIESMYVIWSKFGVDTLFLSPF